MDFRIWASLHPKGPQKYFVTVSAIAAEDPDRTGGVASGEAASLEEGRVLRLRLIGELTTKLRRAGHEVIDVRMAGVEE
jgi:hypothetical protein